MAVPKKRSTRLVKDSKLKIYFKKLKFNNNILKYTSIYKFKKFSNIHETKTFYL